MSYRYIVADPDILAGDFLVDFIHDPDPDRPLQRGLGLSAIKFWQGDFYIWRLGKYTKISDCDTRAIVKKFLTRRNNIFSADRVRITSRLISDVIECLKGTRGVHIPECRSLNSWPDGREKYGIQTFVFKNVTISINNGKDPQITEHTPDYFTTVKMPYNFEPQADYKNWENFLFDVMDGDIERIYLLQQWAGYLLMPDLKQQKFLLIAGEGANGKSVFLEVLEKMLGRENCTHIPLAQFGENFMLANTIGKVANISSESDSDVNIFGETILKSYTSGDSMSFSRKYKEPLEAKPTAKIMIATNHLPKFQDKSQGIWRRMLYVPFERTFAESEQNKNLADELSKNLSGIFNWAIDGMKCLMKNGRFVEPVRCRHALDEYKRDVNPARAYLLDNYTIEPASHGIACSEVYNNYADWCRRNGYRIMSSSNFGKEVKRAFPETERNLKRNGEERFTIYSKLIFNFSEYQRDLSTVATANS